MANGVSGAADVGGDVGGVEAEEDTIVVDELVG